MEINVIVGGAAGQGMDTLSGTLAKILAGAGYGVLSTRDYMSRIRGGHNFSIVRAARETPWTFAPACNLLVCLDEATHQNHIPKLDRDGAFIYDPEDFEPEDERGVAVPMRELARAAGGRIMANTVALGAALALLGLQTASAEEMLLDIFADKEGVGEQNVDALLRGWETVGERRLQVESPGDDEGERIFLEGNQALGMAAAASGCRFFTAYPMTPATGIMTYLAGLEGDNVVVEQAEDEIAAINAVLGASFTGARALTATSGGGFSLMAEGVSLAGMTETPAVIIVAMRPGPATGFPTRTDQGDLGFVLNAGHGEFPRAVLSATHLEDAFYRLNKAFDLADRFQTPVIFLSDQHFADTARTIEPYDFERMSRDQYLADDSTAELPYRRYRLTEDGISPRLLPGQVEGEVVLADSDEHDERGFIAEDAETRVAMMEKRMKKLRGLMEEMDEPVYHGPEDPEILLVGWGSTYGAIREARDQLAAGDTSAGHLHFADIWPLQRSRLDHYLGVAKNSFCVEANYTGQFAELVRRETGLEFHGSIRKYDGRPFTAADILREVEEHVQ